VIDVSEVITDPDFAQPFSILRTTGSFGEGGWIPNASTSIPTYGVITVANEKELDQIPEGDRIKGAMIFHTVTEIRTTNVGGISDQIEWNGDLYKIYQVAPWKDYGYYRAIGSRLTGN
jgi:hypothetical protein